MAGFSPTAPGDSTKKPRLRSANDKNAPVARTGAKTEASGGGRKRFIHKTPQRWKPVAEAKIYVLLAFAEAVLAKVRIISGTT